MKRFKTLFTVALLAASVCMFTSCDMLMELFGDYITDYADDTFSGPVNTWLEMTVSYDENNVAGKAKLAFFYTEQAKTGHTTNGTRLAKDYEIKDGLTILLYGKFSPLASVGITQQSYYIKNIPLDSGAKKTWSVIYNLSSPLRKLEKTGTIPEGEDGKYSWLSGENYGSWQTYHPEDGEALQDNQERVPAPLTNDDNGFYFTNDDVDNKIDWDAALSKIGLSTKNWE